MQQARANRPENNRMEIKEEFIFVTFLSMNMGRGSVLG
jgi:hypothetical protein